MRTRDNNHEWFELAEKLWTRDSNGTLQFTENAPVNCHTTVSKDGQPRPVCAAARQGLYERIQSRI